MRAPSPSEGNDHRTRLINLTGWNRARLFNSSERVTNLMLTSSSKRTQATHVIAHVLAPRAIKAHEILSLAFERSFQEMGVKHSCEGMRHEGGGMNENLSCLILPSSLIPPPSSLSCSCQLRGCGRKACRLQLSSDEGIDDAVLQVAVYLTTLHTFALEL